MMVLYRVDVWETRPIIYLFSELQRGGGAPARELVVNEDEQKAMMAFYYRKQEEMKVGYQFEMKMRIASSDAFTVTQSLKFLLILEIRRTRRRFLHGFKLGGQ